MQHISAKTAVQRVKPAVPPELIISSGETVAAIGNAVVHCSTVDVLGVTGNVIAFAALAVVGEAVTNGDGQRARTAAILNQVRSAFAVHAVLAVAGAALVEGVIPGVTSHGVV